jgi:hypothetical protein
LLYNATIKHLGEYSHGRQIILLKSNCKTTSSAAVIANATRYMRYQSVQTALSGSSYILSDATRGLGVQTYNSARTALILPIFTRCR